MSEIRIIKALKTVAVFALIFITQTRLLASNDSEKQALSNRYVFQSEQSTIIQTGGIAGVNWNYTLEGQFILNVNFDTHIATFEQVDVNAMDDSQYKRTLDPNEVFAMTSLIGVVQNNTTIKFTGKQNNGSTIHLTGTLQNDSLHLVGNTTPPQGSADLFIYNIDAIAKYKYSEGGTGEPNIPYQIAEPNDWVELMSTSSDWDKNFIMTSDIDLNNVTLTPVGTSYPDYFKGIFNGNRHKIYNAEVNMPNSNYVGIFGIVSGQVSNVSLENAKTIGNDYVGCLIGKNSGTVTNCCITAGTCTGNSYIGGLAGTSSGYVMDCSCSCTVSGNQYIGGMIGENTSYNISRASYGYSYTYYCYSSSKVNGNKYVGGLIGSNLGFVEQCYSTGIVTGNDNAGGLVGKNTGDVNDYNCFWDIQTSGKNKSAGGTGKTTSQMYDPNTYLNAGWDFIGETVNGPNDIWWILDGKDYPRLWWQLPEDNFNDSKAEPLWFAYEIEPELAHLEEVNGRLEVYTAGAMEDIDAIYAPYNWGLDANKPFAAKVDFHFSKIGIGDGRMNIGIVPSMNPSAAKWAEFEVGTFDENPFFLYEVRNLWQVEEKVSDRFVNDGTLYVSYDPNLDELYFSNTDYGKEKAIWTISGLIRGIWKADSVYIILSGGSEDGMALTGQDAWLDNFKVSYGAIRQ